MDNSSRMTTELYDDCNHLNERTWYDFAQDAMEKGFISMNKKMMDGIFDSFLQHGKCITHFSEKGVRTVDPLSPEATSIIMQEILDNMDGSKTNPAELDEAGQRDSGLGKGLGEQIDAAMVEHLKTYKKQ